MIKIAAAEFKRHAGHYQTVALSEPVAITRNGRDHMVMLSAEEYRRLTRRARQVLTLDDFTEADIAAPEAARAPGEAKTFDHELM